MVSLKKERKRERQGREGYYLGLYLFNIFKGPRVSAKGLAAI